MAGIQMATQTPPARSNTRAVLLSLDDRTSCSYVIFFTDAQGQAEPLLFDTKLMIIKGRTGDHGIFLQTDAALDLKQMWTEWTAHHQRSRGK